MVTKLTRFVETDFWVGFFVVLFGGFFFNRLYRSSTMEILLLRAKAILHFLQHLKIKTIAKQPNFKF